MANYCYTAAQLCLNDHNPTWVRDLTCDSPEANWKHENISNDPVLNASHPRTETGLKKFEKLLLYYILSMRGSLPLSRITLPIRIQPTLRQKKFLTGRSGHTQMASATFTKKNK